MTYTKDNLRQIFQQPFNANEWQQMLQHYFHATELRAEPERINNTDDDERGYYLGALDTTDSYRIGLFYYRIQHGNVARKRVGLRNLVKSFVNPNWGEFDAALVVFDSGSVWRLSFVCDIKGENTAAKRFTYVFGESDNYYNTPVGRFDALQRNGISFENIKDAFSVERLNKDFFNGYKDYYKKFLKYIDDDTKENRDYVKKLLGRLVFLQFLQKKGWMGVPANQQGWNGGDKFYLNHLIERYEGNDRLLSDVLEPLFFNTLNERRTNDIADARLGDNVKIPYLNGGLFDKDELDKKDIDFPYDYFKELMDFFAMYNFTIDENDPEDSEIGIDPEMLGHIFENLLEDNKDKGAFYTPKEIVQYMSKESVAQYLKSNTPEDLHTAIDSLIKQRVVEPVLQNKENARVVNKALSVVKVCDPAIGSGAFPMGVLNVLFDCRHLLYGFIGKNEDFSYAKVKRDIIQNNIYGVDIEKGAVDIARLRFWLALVVDENEPQPLPNLDYKIMCGDSLLHRFPLEAPFQDVLRDYNQKNGTHYTLDDYRQWVYDYTEISDHAQKDTFRQKIEDIKRAVKTELSNKDKRKISNVRGNIELLKMNNLFEDRSRENEKKIKALQKELKALEQQREEIESNKIYDQAFEWRFEFPALLDENGDFMGFDIVIANPPYVPVGSDEKGKYQRLYSIIEGHVDLYELFIEGGMRLLKDSGTLVYINPNTVLSNLYSKKLRCKMVYEYGLSEIVNFGMDVFDAVVHTCILRMQKGRTITQIGIKKNISDVSELILPVDYSLIVTDIEKTQNFTFDISFNNNERQLFAKLRGLQTLGDYCFLRQCIKTGNDKDFVMKSDTELPKPWKRTLRGKGIDRYIIKENNIYIKYGDWLARNWKNTSFYECPKIAIREAGDKITACIDLENRYFLSSLYAIYPKEHYTINELKALLAVLNSTFATYFVRKIAFDLTQGAFTKMRTNQLARLPLPSISGGNQENLANLVDIIISAKQSGIDTISDEMEIDLLVYHLYGLTYDEVLIVDPETPITREEYEK